MNQKWRIILGICLAIAVCVPMVSAAIQVPTTDYSFKRPSLEQLKVEKSSLPHNDYSGQNPSMIEMLFASYSEGLKNEKSVPYTPLDEPIRLKLISYSTTTNHGYYVAIDGYYQNSQGKYIPHVTYTIAC